MEGLDFYIPGAALAVAFGFRLPGISRSWRDPLLRSVSALLLVAVSVFFFAAPPTIAAVNRITGIPNFSAPLVYCILTAFSASCLVLVINWRGGPPEVTARSSRRVITAYSAVIVAMIVVFALGDAPVERLRDLDTYYANTPYMREMIVLYLVAHTTAAVVMTVLCRRWSLRVHGWLRTGLVLIMTGYFLNLGFDAVKYAAVSARWAGYNLDWLSTRVAPPLASASAIFIAAGFILPLAGQRFMDAWRTWSTYRKLGTLWRELRSAAPKGTGSVRISLWSSGNLRLTQREAFIHDGILALDPYFDHALRADSHAAALAAGADADLADAVAEAAMLAAAVVARDADPQGTIITSADTRSPLPKQAQRDLVGMSRALRHSPVVAAARRSAAMSESSHP
ncbi:MAB_1171c family putative transporter [Streptomyces sp. NPDC005408]|uniref:MAB_1171c family putative transporter n=1 Tax=Streptomyces sp. NPDC005408 TaxID=3155341 RepID=UPI00339E71B8